MQIHSTDLSKTIDSLKRKYCSNPHYCYDVCLDDPGACEMAIAIDSMEMLQNLDELIKIKIAHTKDYLEDSKIRFGTFSDITLDYESRYQELQQLLFFMRSPEELDAYLKVYKGEDK